MTEERLQELRMMMYEDLAELDEYNEDPENEWTNVDLIFKIASLRDEIRYLEDMKRKAKDA